MRRFETDPRCKFLEEGLEKALAGQKQTARIHIIIVHEEAWWCVYANLSVKKTRPHVQATLKTIEETLRSLWPKGVCIPPDDGQEKKSIGLEETGLEYNHQFWLPGKEKTTGDFMSFYPEAKPGT
jgi:hypothetical protein